MARQGIRRPQFSQWPSPTCSANVAASFLTAPWLILAPSASGGGFGGQGGTDDGARHETYCHSMNIVRGHGSAQEPPSCAPCRSSSTKSSPDRGVWTSGSRRALEYEDLPEGGPRQCASGRTRLIVLGSTTPALRAGQASTIAPSNSGAQRPKVLSRPQIVTSKLRPRTGCSACRPTVDTKWTKIAESIKVPLTVLSWAL